MLGSETGNSSTSVWLNLNEECCQKGQNFIEKYEWVWEMKRNDGLSRFVLWLHWTSTNAAVDCNSSTTNVPLTL